MDDPKRFKFEGDQHYLKPSVEMRQLFDELPEACDNTLWVAERADVTIEFGKPKLPAFPLPEGFADDADYLRHLTIEGAHQRWGQPLPEGVVERLTYELGVIAEMGFSSYFLIVWDLIRSTPATTGIRVGPGRGSAAGCAVAYCLRITDLDPIRYDLLFERFLNPSRISMPDIDMDFDSRFRDEMIRYAAEKYGRDRVAQIVTFSTIKARAAVRDAARVLGYPYAVGDKIAKAMPPLVMGRDTPLYACLEPHPKYEDGYKAAAELRAMYETDPDVKQVVDVAKGLEGLRRQDGIHAAAVVITDQPLTDYLPIQRKPESGQAPEDAPIVTQYEMHGVEDLGLLKMDFLGLRNLDVIEDTVQMIRSTKDPVFDIDAVPLDDDPTLALLRKGDSIGVFQLEGGPDAGAHALAGADQLRRRGRPGRPLPARADGGEHAQRLRRPQERPQAHQVPPPRHGGAARRHLRPDDLPGVGDARGAEVRRLLPGRRRQPPQGLRQEDPGADRGRAGEVRRRLRSHRLRRASWARSCSTSSSPSPTTPSTRATPTATASSPTRPPTSRPTTRSSTSPACSPA